MRRFLRRFTFAWQGLVHFVRSEPNARIHLIAASLALILGGIMEISNNEFLWLAVAITGVLSSELLNSALERLSDRISTEQHPLIRQAKDMAAAAVLICSLFALVVAAFIFIPRL